MTADMLEKTALIDMYRKMLKIRFHEQGVYDLFLEGKVPGTLHLYSGEEAVAVGVCSSLRKDDFIVSTVSTHRPHGHYIAKGGQIDKIMAEASGDICLRKQLVRSSNTCIQNDPN